MISSVQNWGELDRNAAGRVKSAIEQNQRASKQQLLMKNTVLNTVQLLEKQTDSWGASNVEVDVKLEQALAQNKALKDAQQENETKQCTDIGLATNQTKAWAKSLQKAESFVQKAQEANGKANAHTKDTRDQVCSSLAKLSDQVSSLQDGTKAIQHQVELGSSANVGFTERTVEQQQQLKTFSAANLESTLMLQQQADAHFLAEQARVQALVDQSGASSQAATSGQMACDEGSRLLNVGNTELEEATASRQKALVMQAQELGQTLHQLAQSQSNEHGAMLAKSAELQSQLASRAQCDLEHLQRSRQDHAKTAREVLDAVAAHKRLCSAKCKESTAALHHFCSDAVSMEITASPTPCTLR